MGMSSTVRHLARLQRLGWALAASGCAALATAAPAVESSPGEPLARVQRAAEQAVRAQVAELQPQADPAALSVDIGRLDARLRLPRCAQPLQATLPPGSTLRHRTVVRVSCGSPQPWSVQIPASVEADADVLVLQRPLPRGAEPREGDVRVVRRRLPGLASAWLSSPDELGPWRLRRPLDAGAPLARDALERAPVVRRGQTVTMVTQAGGIDVRARGEALADAAPGQRVRIRNLESLKVIDGLAVESGQVRIGP